MKKVLLIEVGAKHTIFPPIGLMCLAAVLRKKYDVKIKDYSGKEIDEVSIKKEIETFDPFVVGVRVLTGPPISRAIKISKIAKNLRKIVIWGGPHPTILPEQTLEDENIDAVCIGEGEYTIQDLLKYFEGKLKKVYGAGIKKKGKIEVFPPQKKFVDFNKLPIPAWDILENIDRYFPFKKNNEIPISTTRGCAFKCGFCHNSNKNVKGYLGCYRIAEPKRAIEEYEFVKGLTKKEISILNVGEDLHLVSEDYTKKFCEEISKYKNLKWYTAARYQTLNKEMIDLISKSGCISIMLGVESGSPRIQRMNNKIVELKKAMEIAKELRKKKIFLRNTYIFGHPTETEEELEMSLNYIRKIPSDENLIQLYRPMPGTPYFDLCVQQNKVKIPETLEGWSGFGVLGHDTNVSEIPSERVFSEFYKTNALQQTKYWFNLQRFFLKNKMYEQFFHNFLNNRFTFKLKEYLESRK